MENAILATKSFTANGESDIFRIAGGMTEIAGRVYGVGAVGATLTLYASNSKSDAASFKQVGQLVLAGNDSVLDSKQLSTAMAYGKIVLTGLTGSVDVSASSSVGGATAALGTRADTPATDDSGTWTIVALIKRALQNWTTLLAAITAGVTVKSGAGTVVQGTIVNGQTLSGSIDLGNARLGRIGCPASVDGNTKLSFQTSHDGVSFRNLFDAFGSEYTVVIAADRSVVPDLTMFAGARYLKVRFGTSAVPGTGATANRTFDISTLA